MTAAIEHATAGLPLANQPRSGDRAVVIDLAGGALVGLIDGLGHGEEAAVAADAAARVLEAEPQRTIEELIASCHDALRTTRGAAISVAWIDARRAVMRWIGIGNVEGMLVRAVPGGGGDEALITVGGIVGYRIPRLQARELPLRPGDTLVLATDGVRATYRDEIQSVRDPRQIADCIIACCAKPTDDACVVVARFRGPVDDAGRVEVEDEADVARARIRVRDRARSLGFAHVDIEALATAVSELARNVIVHATRGEVVFVPVDEPGRAGLAVVVRDRGPGITDVARALSDDFSTAGGLGCGLSGARRLVDELHLESEPGAGTVVTIKKWLR